MPSLCRLGIQRDRAEARTGRVRGDAGDLAGMARAKLASSRARTRTREDPV